MWTLLIYTCALMTLLGAITTAVLAGFVIASIAAAKKDDDTGAEQDAAPQSEIPNPKSEIKNYPRVMCMDCGKVVRPGTFPASHGLCPDCKDARMASIPSYKSY